METGAKCPKRWALSILPLARTVLERGEEKKARDLFLCCQDNLGLSPAVGKLGDRGKKKEKWENGDFTWLKNRGSWFLKQLTMQKSTKIGYIFFFFLQKMDHFLGQFAKSLVLLMQPDAQKWCWTKLNNFSEYMPLICTMRWFVSWRSSPGMGVGKLEFELEHIWPLFSSSHGCCYIWWLS